MHPLCARAAILSSHHNALPQSKPTGNVINLTKAENRIQELNPSMQRVGDAARQRVSQG